ncbi:metal-sulfur cluster assembly factor [Virgibacillus byunsanensis]|uniref:Metal-sulfur cluster assembly factor n=1 Tax=Virgibacillus byunsanensis TaxID=570945 RepID=A0ABW3LHW3_9BACI
MSLQTEVGAALYEVIDPELGVNIMDLGLIYDIKTDENNNVNVIMTLTTPGCPLHDSITEGAKNQILKQVEDVGEVSIDLVWEPAWSPTKMSDKAREILMF